MPREIDILIIGAGPAGLGAVIESAGSGANVLLMDENSSSGGQLFKQIHKFFGSETHFSGVRVSKLEKSFFHRPKMQE